MTPSLSTAELDRLADLIAAKVDFDHLSDLIASKVASMVSDPPLLIDKEELARRTQLSISTIERRMKDGTLPVVKLGRRVMFSPDEVLRALSDYDGTAEPR